LGPLRLDRLWLGQLWLGQLWLGQLWLGQLWLGQLWLGQLWLGQLVSCGWVACGWVTAPALEAGGAFWRACYDQRMISVLPRLMCMRRPLRRAGCMALISWH
jgi:hypothetical protein